MTRSEGALSRSSSRKIANSGLHDIKTKARRGVLQRSRSSGLRPSSKVGEFTESLECQKTVLVEARPHNLKSSILYASDSQLDDSSDLPFTETEFVTINPKSHEDDIVYQDDSFEIYVLGMSVSPQDGFSFNNNELLLYSLKADVEAEDSSAESIPFIHFDPKDAHDSGSEPDQFIPVPSTKSLFLSHNGEREGANAEIRKQIFCRFSIMEIDKVSETQKSSIEGIGNLGNYARTQLAAGSQLGILGPALSLASTVGKRALNAYARPDRVLNTDFRFLLAEPENQNPDPTSARTAGRRITRSGDFLRYGYYFFLSHAIDAKLFATTGISSNNVTLMLKRADQLSPGETKFFPLTGVSYLAIQVSRGVKSNKFGVTRSPVQVNHAQRIEALLHQSFGLEESESLDEGMGEESYQQIFQQVQKLAKDLGF